MRPTPNRDHSRGRLALLAFACALWVVSACGGEVTPSAGDPCQGSEDCGAQQSCIDAVCADISEADRTRDTVTPDSQRFPESTSSRGTDHSPEDSGDEPGSTATTPGLPGTSPGESRSSQQGADDYQQPCTENTDCESGLCLHSADGRRCSHPCTSGSACEGELDWRCTEVILADGEDAEICFPAHDNLCASCESDAECMGADDLCVHLDDGSFCGLDCRDDGPCPPGYACELLDNDAQCLPLNNHCGACFGVDFDTNPDHCGRCGEACALANAQADCVSGDCVLVSCESGFADCNGLPDDGCEIDLASNDAHCGACNSPCTGGQVCEEGICGCPGEELFVEELCQAPSAPEVRTDEPTLTTQSAELRATLEAAGIPRVTRHGFCWFEGTERPEPSTRDAGDDAPTEEGSAGERFEVDGMSCVDFHGASEPGTMTYLLDDLSPASQWTYFAFATVGEEAWVEGDQITFRVLQEASVTTAEATEVTPTGARLGGEITNAGVPLADNHGVCWGTMAQPDLESADCEELGSTDEVTTFSVDVGDLTPATDYVARAFVRNDVGTRYGAPVEFLTPRAAEVSTLAPDQRRRTSFRMRGEITTAPLPNATSRGFCWTQGNSLPDESHTCISLNPDPIDAVFTHTATGLTPQRSHRVRAWVENERERIWGEARTVTTCNTTDFPNGQDLTCDGVDGDVNRSVLVSATTGSSSSNCGSLQTPCRTINDALERVSEIRTYILVTSERYDESVVLPDGISLYGGYNVSTWMRDNNNPTRLVSPLPWALRVEDYSSDGVVQGFQIRSAPGTAEFPSSTALILQNVTGEVFFRNNEIEASRGLDGAAGAEGARGADGVVGSLGLSGRQGFEANGGGGGTSPCAQNGTPGGRGIHGEDGRGGAPAIRTAGGLLSGGSGGAVTSCALPGNDGDPGNEGDEGSPGARATAVAQQARGAIDGTQWRALGGNAGGAGTPGDGGTGGGGGGGLLPIPGTCGIYSGGGGGGGGSGGCEGQGGGPGMGGGGSIAVLAINASGAAFRDSTLITAGGGDGGRGGDGGEGGAGGPGGEGGLSALVPQTQRESGAGGEGGVGGDGGDGGGGGGGAGGMSVGFLLVNSSISRSSITYNIGPAGEGGAGGARGSGALRNGSAGIRGNFYDW